MQQDKKELTITFQLPQLPYEIDALQPWMSKETLEYHFGKHHQAYITKLNAAITGTKFEKMSLDEIVFQSKDSLFNNAAQVWNHNFFWHGLTPKGKSEPKEQLAIAINKYFGSFGQFKRKFSDAALDLFGSGWVWLVEKGNGILSIESLADAGNPMTKDWKPVLACDVWEHAYYIDYRNDRSKYLESYWELVDWEFVLNKFNLSRRT